jgi:uncharacterized membrane protein YphA (DoxX/SURF4 family)
MKKFLLTALRVVPAIILLQTLFFKFTGAEQSIQLFTQLGAEPAGRYISGFFELIAGILLLMPTKAIQGAYLAVVLMIGALGAHFTTLGFEGMNSQLAGMAVIVVLTSLGVIYTQKKNTCAPSA